MKCSKEEKIFFFDNIVTLGGQLEFSVSGEDKGNSEKKIREAIEKYNCKYLFTDSYMISPDTFIDVEKNYY